MSLQQQQEDEMVILPLLEAANALRSSVMARKIRKIRSSRGLKESIAIKRRKPQKVCDLSKSVSNNNLPKPVLTKKEEAKPTLTNTKTKPKPKPTPQHFSYQSTFGVMKAYHSLHSDLVMPRRFIVPESHGKFGTVCVP